MVTVLMSETVESIGYIEHIAWDWNGTLLDDAHACVTALNRMLRKRNMAAIDRRQYCDVFDFPVRDYYRRLGFDFEREDWNENAREFHTYYFESGREACLRPDAVNVLTALSEQGIAMSILSASETGTLREMLARYGLLEFFPRVYGLSDPYAHTKLEQGRALIRDLQLPTHHILLVGDTTHDYEVARAIGCRCILLAGGHQSEHRLRRCGCPVIAELPEVLALLDQAKPR